MAVPPACALVGEDSLPLWISEAPVVANIAVSDTIGVALRLIRNGRATVAIDFESVGLPPGLLTIQTLPLPEVRHLAGDTIRKRIYATVSGAALARANSLLVIDLVTLAIEHAAPVGSNPGALAITDDGTTLWVGIDGAFSIRLMALTSTPPETAAQFALPKTNPFFCGDVAGAIAPVPGSSSSVAVSLHIRGLSQCTL